MGLRTSPIGELLFDGVYVPEENVIGRVGGGAPVFAESMDWERALLGACHVGAMQRLLEGTVRHARTRKQFGQLIGKNQAVSHKIADMKVGLEAARWLIRSEEHTSELQSLMRISYAVFCLKKNKKLILHTIDH